MTFENETPLSQEPEVSDEQVVTETVAHTIGESEVAHFRGHESPKSTPTYKRSSGAGVIVGAVVGAIIGALVVAGIAGVLFFNLYAKNNDTRTVAQSSQTIQVGKSTKPSTELSVNVAQAVLPSVVSITSKGSAQLDPFTGQSYSSSDSGSGVLIKSNGYILTNNHVVNGGTDIEVLVGNKTYKAKVVGTDSTTDLAVLKIEGTNFTPINIGTSSNLKVGQYVMALGSPFGLNNSVTTGIISALGRSNMVAQSRQVSTYVNLIQTDAAVNPGNSGGALVNEKGELIGINTLISSTSGSSAGVGFAIPVDTAVDIANQLIKTGKATHPFLGVSTQSIDAQVAAAYKLPVSKGAYVVYVAANSPAKKAGLQRGDIITEVAGKPVSAAEDVYTTIREHKVGDSVSLTFYRGDKKQTATVTLISDAAFQSSSTQSQPSVQQNSYGYSQSENAQGLTQ